MWQALSPWGSINYFGLGFDSIYNAASVTLRRRFARNFFYRVNYTFAKSIDDGSQLQGPSAGSYAGVQDAQNIKLGAGVRILTLGTPSRRRFPGWRRESTICWRAASSWRALASAARALPSRRG